MCCRPRCERFFDAEGAFPAGSVLPRMELGAASANTVFDLKHRKDFGKVAVVGATMGAMVH